MLPWRPRHSRGTTFDRCRLNQTLFRRTRSDPLPSPPQYCHLVLTDKNQLHPRFPSDPVLSQWQDDSESDEVSGSSSTTLSDRSERSPFAGKQGALSSASDAISKWSEHIDEDSDSFGFDFDSEEEYVHALHIASCDLFLIFRLTLHVNNSDQTYPTVISDEVSDDSPVSPHRETNQSGVSTSESEEVEEWDDDFEDFDLDRLQLISAGAQ